MFGNIFNGVKKAKKGSNYGARLPLGSHRVVLKKYGPKPTDKEDSKAGAYLLESTHLIASTTNPELKENDSRDWPWFIMSPGWGGTFARQNAQQMLEAIMRSIDLSVLPKNELGQIVDPRTGAVIVEEEQGPNYGKPKTEHDVASIGQLASDDLENGLVGMFRGIQLQCEVVQSYNKKTKKFNTAADGTPYTDAVWKPVPGQTFDSILEMRNYLDTIDPLPVKSPAQTAAASAPVANVGGYAVAAPVAAAPAPVAAAPAPVAAPVAAPVVPAAAASASAAMPTALAAMLAKTKPTT